MKRNLSDRKRKKSAAALKAKPSRENNIFDFPPKIMCTSRVVSECEGRKQPSPTPSSLADELLTTIQKWAKKYVFQTIQMLLLQKFEIFSGSNSIMIIIREGFVISFNLLIVHRRRLITPPVST